MIKSEKQTLKEARETVEATVQAQALLQELAQTIQQRTHSQVAAIVTKALTSVFNKPYEFKIIFEKKRGKTDARLVYVRGGFEIDPKEEAGGGVLDVAAFALRVACLMLTVPRRRRLIVLDEPFKGVHKSLFPRVTELMHTLAKELDVQFIMVTQIEGLVTGTEVRLGE